jgi:hypothetical protein
MREWNLRAGDPLSLFLAADARFCGPDYADDQVWELSLGGEDPPALSVESTLGLRAVCLRIFPVFTIANRPIQDPATFASPPVVRRFAPNYIEVRCRPVAGLEAQCEYWVPESHALAGRITLRTTGPDPLGGEFGLAGILRPAAEGEPFAIDSAGPYEGAYLRGRMRNSVPVLLTAGAAGIGRGPIPALKLPFEIESSKPQSLRWVFCCRASAEESLRTGRAVLAREWDAEIARIELADASLPEIETGRADWDAVLAFSQQTAIQALIGPTQHLPYPSPVIGRNPERGYSLRGDGSDYAPGWSGAGLGDLLMILPVWALAHGETAKDLVRNFVAASGDGLPDARPGAARQRSGLLAPPLLAQAAGRALGGREDVRFLDELWPLAGRCLEAWFGPEHDRDRDGAPEWERPDSFGPDVPPLLAREDPWGGWVRPEEVESPALIALLIGECHAAARMAERAGSAERVQYWKQRSEELRGVLGRMETAGGYRAIDRDTHRSPEGRRLWDGRLEKETAVHAAWQEPARVLLRCAGALETRPVVRIILQGRDADGRPREEEFRSERFAWLHGAGTCFSGTIWTRIDAIRTEGAPAGMTLRLEIPELQREDLSEFLPLWSRSVPAERAADLFARLSEGSEFDSPAGLRFVPRSDRAAGMEGAGGVGMFWNMLLGEAALRYGKTDLVRGWIEKWMGTLAGSLRMDRSFRSRYDPQQAGGSGPRNSALGIFPVGLFLSALGVHPVSATRLLRFGRSIFSFPVTVRWRGLTIRCEGDLLSVIFPSGEEQTYRGADRILITDPAEGAHSQG